MDTDAASATSLEEDGMDEQDEQEEIIDLHDQIFEAEQTAPNEEHNQEEIQDAHTPESFTPLSLNPQEEMLNDVESVDNLDDVEAADTADTTQIIQGAQDAEPLAFATSDAIADEAVAVTQRPAPAADKSNAAYLTSLLDGVLDTPQDAQGETAPHEERPEQGQEEEVISTMPDVESQADPIVEEKAKGLRLVTKIQHVAKSASKESVQGHPAMPPVIKVSGGRRLGKPKGTVPFEPHSVDSLSGGQDWVGEPMPMGSPVAKSTPQVVVKPVARAVAPVEVAAEKEEKAVSRISVRSVPRVKVAPKVQQPTAKESLAQTPIQEPTSESWLQAQRQERPQGNQQGMELSFAALSGESSAEWVGEPMPIQKATVEEQAGGLAEEKAAEAVQVEEKLQTSSQPMEFEPLAFTSEATQAEEAQAEYDSEDMQESLEPVDSLHMEGAASSPKNEAENRGREELRHLRDYLSKIEAVNPLKRLIRSDKTQNPPQEKEQKAFSPFDWVGEPTPVAKSAASSAQEKDPIGMAEKGDEAMNEQVQQREQGEQGEQGMQAKQARNLMPWDRRKPLGAQPAQLIPEPVNLSIDLDSYEEEKELSPIDSLLIDLDGWLAEAKEHLHANNTQGVEAAVASMANNAEAFGLRTLARFARTVEAAAKAQDVAALHDLVPELDMSVQRNKTALRG